MFLDPRDFAPGAFAKLAPTCAECGAISDIAQVEFIYPNRRDLWVRDDGSTPWFWYCSSCNAYVGADRHSLKPLGRPGGKETRDARQAAHAIFDPMWQKRMRIAEAAGKPLTRNQARGRGYKWLAAQMGMTAKECHIAMLNAADARRVVEICEGAKRG